MHLVTSSFLLLVAMPLFLVVMHMLLVAMHFVPSAKHDGITVPSPGGATTKAQDVRAEL